MFGVFLTAIATFFHEIGDVIGRKKVLKNEETIYTMGFLNMFWILILFLLIIVFKNEAFRFSAASLPFFSIRALLEIIQVHITLVAMVESDRSTFGFVRTLTIPLLLGVDIILGYTIAITQIIGISFIIISMLILFLDHDFNKKGIWFILFGSVNAVATISLYKHNISNFNSVAAEQSIMMIILIVYLLVCAWFFTNQNPFKFLTKRVYFLQSFSQGIGGLLESFAYLFAPASIIIAAKRSSAVLWATLSGNLYFQERHVLVKLSMFLFLTAGIVLIIV